MFTWFAPGRTRHTVSALRNSASESHARSSTMTYRAQADSPPPKLASAMRRKASASAPRVTGARWPGPSTPATTRGARPASLMKELRVGRQLPDVVRFERQRIGWDVVLGPVPIVLEQLAEPRDDLFVVEHHAELAADVESAAIDVHRAEQGTLAVGKHQLGVQ